MKLSTLWFHLATICTILVATTTTAARSRPNSRSTCEKITDVEMCTSDMTYNFTRLPNMHGHTSQMEINDHIDVYKVLVARGCSRHLRYFLCASFVPMCSAEVDVSITACRSVCEHVRNSCIAVLHKYDLPWPDELNCTRFPLRSDKNALCMHLPSVPANPHGSTDGQTSVTIKQGNDAVVQCPLNTMYRARGTSEWLGGECVPKCGEPVMFSTSHKSFVKKWMGGWAILCAVVTLFTVATYALETSRFRFPERSIIYLAGCYHIYAWIHILRAYVFDGSDLACVADGATGEKYLITDGSESILCTINFILSYYFQLASSLWWLILTITWYLSASRGWCADSVENYMSCFHFVAWGIPALPIIGILVMHKIDAFELTSLCGVGNNDYRTMLAFEVVPSAVVLLTGLAFVIAGFCSIYPAKDALKEFSIEVTKLERFMWKVAIFSLLYMVPAGIVLACHLYHAYMLYLWEKHMSTYTSTSTTNQALQPQQQPPQLDIQVFSVQVFMQLIIGTTCGMWIFSKKTCKAWGRCLCCRNGRHDKVKHVVQNHNFAMTHMPPTPGPPSHLSSGQQYQQHRQAYQQSVHMNDPSLRPLVQPNYLYQTEDRRMM